MRLGHLLVVLSAALFAAPHAKANAWLKEKGDGEIISSSTISRQESGLAPGNSVSAYSALYLEYGALQNATVVADASAQQYTAENESQSAFDTAWLGLRVPLRRWDYSILSVEARMGASGIRKDASASSGLSIDGTGEARLMFGDGFDVLGRHAFASIEGGWRWRPGPPADELAFDATAGIEPWSSGLLMLQTFSIVGMGPARGAYRRYDLVKAQLSFAQRITSNWWIQLGALDTLAGSDAGEFGGVFALWRRF